MVRGNIVDHIKDRISGKVLYYRQPGNQKRQNVIRGSVCEKRIGEGGRMGRKVWCKKVAGNKGRAHAGGRKAWQ